MMQNAAEPLPPHLFYEWMGAVIGMMGNPQKKFANCFFVFLVTAAIFAADSYIYIGLVLGRVIMISIPPF